MKYRTAEYLFNQLVTEYHIPIVIFDKRKKIVYPQNLEKAPEGYILDSQPILFNIKNDQTEAVQVVAKNIRENHDVLLKKVDSKTNKTLEGAIFELQDASGKTLQKDLKTDSLGQIIIKGLQPENYQFVETKAPEGYQLDSTPVKFTITKDSTETVKVTKTNDKILEKKDTDSSGDNGSKDSQKALPLTGEKTTLILSLIGIFILSSLTLCIVKKKSINK